jgi:hypothetical protein
MHTVTYFPRSRRLAAKRLPSQASFSSQEFLPAGVLAKNSIHRNNVTQLLQQTGYTCLHDSVSLRQETGDDFPVILTSTYRGSSDVKRDLLDGFSAIDRSTSLALDESQLDHATSRLLLRFAALCSLHGDNVPRDLISALQDCEDPFATASHALDSGEILRTGVPGNRRELQQELVHFSRIVDLGTVGFAAPPSEGSKRIRNSHRLPSDLKVLAELMTVTRGRRLQRGLPVTPAGSRRPGAVTTEPHVQVLVQYPRHSEDYVLVAAGGRRRLRQQAAFYFGNLLPYLPPGDAFTVLTAYLSDTAATSGLRLVVLTADTPLGMRAATWAAPSVLPEGPFAATLSLLPQFTEVRVQDGADQPSGVSTGPLSVACQEGKASIVFTEDGGLESRLALVPVMPTATRSVANAAGLANRAADLLRSRIGDAFVRSIECGHIHLDRDLDIDQETGAQIGATVFRLLSGQQTMAPLLCPMMDDDHVLVKLRPLDYLAFLRRHFPGSPLRLIPESSPVIGAIAVSLFARLLSTRQEADFARRGRNLFLYLDDGSTCELFEDFTGSPVTGCVLFEVALLVYRTAPDEFDAYISRRFSSGADVHQGAAQVLDGDEPHDAKVRSLMRLYEKYQAVADPASPDEGFSALVSRVLDAVSPGMVHLNVLEDYYEVQQGKVRELLAALRLPFGLVTVFFNVQSGRVSVEE